MKLIRAFCATAALVLSGPAFAYTDSLQNNVPAGYLLNPDTGTPVFSVANPGHVDGGITQAGGSVPINISSATTTQLVAASGSLMIQVTSWDVVAGGNGTITLEYGTGSNCGTGTHALTGPYSFIANSGIAKGNGLGPVLFVPAGNALCALTSASVQMSGSLSYSQF